MKTILLACFLGVSAALLAGCGGSGDSKATSSSSNSTAQTAPATGNEVAIIKTVEGDMVVEFWTDTAPKTVENFKALAKKGYYDGTAFHRIIKGFMIQGGDPNTKDTNAAAAGSYGMGGPGYTIPDEFNSRQHVRGVLSMAHTGAPNSGGSQFFICLGDAAPLNNKYTVFGHVIKGDDVLGKIGDTACTGPNAMGEMSIPIKRMAIESVKIVPADSVK